MNAFRYVQQMGIMIASWIWRATFLSAEDIDKIILKGQCARVGEVSMKKHQLRQICVRE